MRTNLLNETAVIRRLISIKRLISVLEEQRQIVAATETKLKRMIDEYKQERFILFKNRLRRVKKGWCTSGKHLTSLTSLRFLFKTGKRWHTGHESDFLREYAELHRGCSACRKKELEMSGRGGGDGSYHYTFPTKKKGKEFLYKNHGAWTRVPEEAKIQEIPGYVLTSALATELGLPKALDYSSCPFTVITDS